MLQYIRAALVCLCLSFASRGVGAQSNPDWTTPLAPFQIADNLYYVGSRDLAAYLITTPAGNILINANLESSPPQIRASVEKLGPPGGDTKILLNGQCPFDHMAGAAANSFARRHARDMVMDGDADVVRSGGRKDFAHWRRRDTRTSSPCVPSAPRWRYRDAWWRHPHGGSSPVATRVACTTWTFRTHISSASR